MTTRLIRRSVATIGALALAAGAVLAAAPPAAAEPFCTVTWAGGSGSWSDPTGWSGGEVPGADDYVCILRAPGQPVPVVTVGAAVTVAGLTLAGTNLRLPVTVTTLTAGEIVLTRSTLAGRGAVTGTDAGAIRFDDTRLAGGVAVHALGSLFFTHSVLFAGGSTLDQPGDRGLAVFTGQVVLSDLDGHPGNHASLHAFDIQIVRDQSVSIHVPFALRDTAVDVEGDLWLWHLDGFGADGRWAPAAGTYSWLRGSSPGRIILPRTFTTLGPGAIVEGTGFTVSGPTDALADLEAVQGTLILRQSLALPRALDVGGRIDVQAPNTLRTRGITVRGGASAQASSATIAAPSVQVEAGGAFGATTFLGRLASAGRTTVPGSHLGALGLTATANTTVSLRYRADVDRNARVGGRLTVLLPGPRDLPADGTRVVVLAAASLTGTFSSLVTSPARRGSVTLEYTPTQVVAVYHAPSAA